MIHESIRWVSIIPVDVDVGFFFVMSCFILSNHSCVSTDVALLW
jgi:hypothetical protein